MLCQYDDLIFINFVKCGKLTFLFDAIFFPLSPLFPIVDGKKDFLPIEWLDREKEIEKSFFGICHFFFEGGELETDTDIKHGEEKKTAMNEWERKNQISFCNKAETISDRTCLCSAFVMK